MIYGGTTPTHTFTLPFDTYTVSEVRVLYAPEHGKAVVVKETSDCELSGNSLFVTLTQEDTLKLDDYPRIRVQLRLLMSDGTALSTETMLLATRACLEDAVLECKGEQ